LIIKKERKPFDPFPQDGTEASRLRVKKKMIIKANFFDEVECCAEVRDEKCDFAIIGRGGGEDCSIFCKDKSADILGNEYGINVNRLRGESLKGISEIFFPLTTKERTIYLIKNCFDEEKNWVVE